MTKNKRIYILATSIIVIVAIYYVFPFDNIKALKQSDSCIITNRLGETLHLNQADTLSLTQYLMDFNKQQPEDSMIKTVFYNRIEFFKGGKKLVTLKASTYEMFSSNRMQVLYKNKPYHVEDNFYRQLDEISKNSKFDIATD